MRSLKTPDFFKFYKIIKKMEIREELKKVAKEVANVKPKEKEQVQNEMQIELFIMQMGLTELTELYIQALKKGMEDKLFQQWLVDYNRMTSETFIFFADYKSKTFKI